MSEQVQLIFWLLSVLYIGVGLWLAYRILHHLGYVPVDSPFTWASVLMVFAGGAMLANALQNLTFNVIQLITLLTAQGGKDALMPSVWGSVPAWIYILLDIGVFVLIFALAVRFGWGHLPELLAWTSTAEGEEEPFLDLDLAEKDTAFPDDEEVVFEEETHAEQEVLPFLEQALLLFGLSHLAYSLLGNVLRLIMFVPFLRQPQQARTNMVGFGAAWAAGIVLFAMVGYLVYNKATET